MAFRGGRVDAIGFDSPGVPEPQQDLVDSCGHSFSGVQLDVFPDVPELNDPTNTQSVQHFDSTNVHPDNNMRVISCVECRIVVMLVQSNRNPLVVGLQPAWDVTPAEKAGDSDRWFNSLDHQQRGFIQDDIAVPFMLDHKLSGKDLALIWDLADMNSDGKLTRDEFAIELCLDQKKRNGVPIPTSLVQSLIPPSTRGPNSEGNAS
ncbi:hypothetical protein DFH08DRAFT_1039238 [Mycena albidolilacea]|uniref:Uncharacterized protein n=1 Tax=Mycena albidolilacea TaxID=1033008 RepID=A0AAD7AJ47_9AGAR|nr:hypothetical protein DFH08DRAFT_1039238 [Mycena albidolilacea]